MVVLVVVLLCGFFLYPTIAWYGFVPQDTKELATGSNVQIKEYSRGQASRDLRSLKELVADDPQAALPSEFSYLKEYAKENYKSMKRSVPRNWTLGSLFAGFYNEQDMFDSAESYYRTSLLELKTLGNKALQLGLDLEGGMSILLELMLLPMKRRLARLHLQVRFLKLFAKISRFLRNVLTSLVSVSLLSVCKVMTRFSLRFQVPQTQSVLTPSFAERVPLSSRWSTIH